ncbi:MAG: magnesium transporter [Calditrichaeota bacterium]|nr:MAG: magnesium transporter [Calditrichota bacterium]
MSSDRIILENFITHHAADAARILEQLRIDETVAFLQEIPNELAMAIFNHLEHYTAVKSLELIGPEKSAAIVEKLPLQVVSVFLRRLNPELRKAILNLVTEKIAVPLRRLLGYPAESAGALADPLVLALPEDISIKEALRRVQKRPEKALYYLYILSRDHILTGVLTLRELMLARPTATISSVMHRSVVRLSAELDFGAILNHPAWQDKHALPVVDKSGILLGAIDYKTLRRIEKGSERKRLPQHALNASIALGELYTIGLSGLVRSATVPLKDRSENN